MHELAICSRIVDAACAGFAEHRGRPVRIQVAVGGMHQIDPDFMHNAYQALTRDTVLEGTVLVLRFIPVRVKCRACEWEGKIDLPFFSCGACGSTSVDVCTGHELFLERLTVTEETPA